MVDKLDEWRDIPGECNYQCTITGRVRNTLTKRELTPLVRRDGYYYFTLAMSERRNQSLHRIVMLTWVDNPENKPQVNHKDGNKLNNIVSNLEWCTVQENRIHAVATGLITNTTKGRRPHSKLDETQVKTIRKCLSDGMGCNDLAGYFRVSPSLVSAIKRGKAWVSLN